MDIFYLVWESGNWYTKHRYGREEDAKAEAEKLAGLNPGKELFVLKAIIMSKTEKPVQTILLSEPLPF